MRFLTLPFFSYLILSLIGCSSSAKITPPIRTITAMTQGDTSHIYWLDERLNIPQTLTELTLMKGDAKYSREYRWVDNVVREIQGEGDVWIDGKFRHQSFIVRYNSKGLGVYQDNRLDGDLLPIRNTDLVRYYEASQYALKKVKELQKNKEVFFQGHVKNKTFVSCTSDAKKTLIFDENLPLDLIKKVNAPEYFIAAVGGVGGKTDIVEEIIYLGKGNESCFKLPDFKAL